MGEMVGGGKVMEVVFGVKYEIGVVVVGVVMMM